MRKIRINSKLWLSRARFSAAIFLGVSLFTLFMFFIGTRLENPDLSPAAPTPQENIRQELAVESARIAAGAAALKLSDLAAAADSWTKQLGGVWIPWPEGAPNGYENPPLDLSAKSKNFSELTAELQIFAKNTANLGPGFAAGSEMVNLAGNVLQTAENLALKNNLPSVLPPINTFSIAAQINDPHTVIALDTVKQVLEAHTAQLPAAQNLQRKINRKNIALLDALINDALESGTADERTGFVPPTTKLAAIKPVFLNTLSNLAQNEQQSTILKNTAGKQSENKAAAKNAQPSVNEMLASLIAALSRSF
ncbi:hypothetical protein RQN30_02880 [Arcanobacterium hippocoleae]